MAAATQQVNYVVYDLETTGLVPGVAGVCEVALLGIDSVTLQEIGRYEAIIAPYDVAYYDEDGKRQFKPYEVSPIALQINGLTMHKINGGKPLKEVLEGIAKFAKTCFSGSKKPVLVGHNIRKFDNPHFGNMFESGKKDVGKSFNTLYSIDTMHQSQIMWPHMITKGDHTLDGLCERLGVEKHDAHSAMPDVLANTGAFVKITKLQRGENVQIVETVKDRPRDTFKF